MRTHRLDAIVCPTFRPPWFIDLRRGDGPGHGNGAAGPANAAGYPHLTVPAGFAGELPVGISFMARAWDEPSFSPSATRTNRRPTLAGPQVPPPVQRGSLRGTIGGRGEGARIPDGAPRLERGPIEESEAFDLLDAWAKEHSTSS